VLDLELAVVFGITGDVAVEANRKSELSGNLGETTWVLRWETRPDDARSVGFADNVAARTLDSCRMADEDEDDDDDAIRLDGRAAQARGDELAARRPVEESIFSGSKLWRGPVNPRRI
jgi:hypothetical protein